MLFFNSTGESMKYDILKTLPAIFRRRLYSLRTHKTLQHVFDRSPQRNNNISIGRSMLNYLQQNLPNLALDIFSKNLLLGHSENIDDFAISLAIKASRGDPFRIHQIHGFSLTSGFTSHRNVSNPLMNYYCKAGRFDFALCMFRDLSCPDIVSWNTILSGFEKSDEALNFACRMNLSGVVFDAVTYTTVLSFCSTHEEFCFGWQLHSLIWKCGLDGEVYVGNALISMYSRWGRLVEARRIFEEMPEKDNVSWGAIISGYTQQEIHGFEAVCLFVEMVRKGVDFDHVSFSSAIAACSQEKYLDLGRQIHGLSVKRAYDKHMSVGNVLISTYSKCEAVEDAKLVFQQMVDRNVISWTSMISVNEENAVSLFNEMRLDGVLPNDVTFISLISAITAKNLVKEGRAVHGVCLRTGFLSDPNICNSLITMYAKFESMKDAVKVFEELSYEEIVVWNALISGYVQNGLYIEAMQTFFSAITVSRPNQYSFGSILSAIGAAEDLSLEHGQRCHSYLIKLGLNDDPVVSSALLDMYAKRGSIEESQRVFQDMPERRAIAWTVIISAYSRHGEYELVLDWLKRMEKEGVRPDSITFLSLLAACGRKGMIDTGIYIFDSMIRDYQIEPTPEHYSCMVDLLGRAGRLDEAAQLMSKIPGGPGLSTLQSLLGACTIHCNLELGEKVADALMEMEPSESGAYVLMSNLYAEKGQWEKMAMVRKRMRDKEVKKEIGFSWVDVGNNGASMSLHKFSSGDKSHPQYEMIYSMAQCLGFEMKSLRDRQRYRTLEL